MAAIRSETTAADPPPAEPALHVLAGNVPGVGVFGVVAALLTGVPSLVKPPRASRSCRTSSSRRSTVAPELQRAIAIAPWRGGPPTSTARPSTRPTSSSPTAATRRSISLTP
jgi:hypothetical protein